MALNKRGDLLATASEKGTLVRLWKVNSEKPLAVSVFRRGADKAEINDIQFGSNSNYLSVASDHTTIHIFQIEQGSIENATEITGVDEEFKDEGQPKQ